MTAIYFYISDSFQKSFKKNQVAVVTAFKNEENRQDKSLEEQLKAKAAAYSSLLAKSTAQAMYNFDLATVQQTADEYLKDKEVESVVIKDVADKIVAGKEISNSFHSVTTEIRLDKSDKLGTATIYVNQSGIAKNREAISELFTAETKNISNLIQSNQTLIQSTLLLAIIIGTLILVIIVYALTQISVIRPLFKPILNATNSMKLITEKMLSLSEKNSETSLELSKNADSFSSQMQEISASITEISSIVTETSAITSSNRDLVGTNAHTTEAGQETVQELNKAIEDINQSQVQIVSGFESTMNQLRGLMSSIENIHAQLEVMKDIVFQTKLLSFNASVEAARAGEHGKGFSVVAEEIGQLATHSNKSAEDIFAIIEKSKIQATKNINESQNIVKTLVDEIDQKIRRGNDLVSKVNDTFKIVINNSSQLNSSAEQVSISTDEQAKSVQEIQKSIEHANRVNGESLTGIHKLSEYSLTLKKELESIDQLSIELQDLVGISVKNKST